MTGTDMLNRFPTEEAAQAEIERKLIQEAKDLRPLIIAQRQQAQERTFYTEEVHQRFVDAGFYRMQIPKKYGGLEVSPRTFYRVATEIARADMGTGWCLTLASNHALLVANWFPESVQDEVFANADFRAPSTDAPAVIATPRDGGFELNGTVRFCSGVPYSNHFLGQAVIRGEEGAPDRYGIYVAPKSEFTRLDDWGYTLGLRSSGSHSIVFDGGFIPAAYMIEDTEMTFHGFNGPSPGSTAHGNPLYTGRHLSTFTYSLAAVTIGGGFNALDEYERVMRKRTTMVPPVVPRVEDPDYRRWFAGARSRLLVLDAAMTNLADQWLELATLNHEGVRNFTPTDDKNLSAVARELMIQAWEVVEDTLVRTIGTSSLVQGTDFDLVYRDLSQAISHANPQLRDYFLRDLAADHFEPVQESTKGSSA